MKIGDRCFVHGYIDEIRKDTVIIRNNGGYFGTIPSEVITGEIIRCKDCKYFDSGTDEDGKLFFKCLGWVYGGTSEDDFCSRGERKDE